MIENQEIEENRSRVGDLFRQYRERRGLSLDDIFNHTRIRRSYLEALETGRYDLLPAHIYARNFVRNYAAALELDPDQMLILFEEDAKGQLKEPQPEFKIRPEESRLPALWLVLLTLFVLGGAYGGWYFWKDKNSQEDIETVSNPVIMPVAVGDIDDVEVVSNPVDNSEQDLPIIEPTEPTEANELISDIDIPTDISEINLPTIEDVTDPNITIEEAEPLEILPVEIIQEDPLENEDIADNLGILIGRPDITEEVILAEGAEGAEEGAEIENTVSLSDILIPADIVTAPEDISMVEPEPEDNQPEPIEIVETIIIPSTEESANIEIAAPIEPIAPEISTEIETEEVIEEETYSTPNTLSPELIGMPDATAPLPIISPARPETVDEATIIEDEEITPDAVTETDAEVTTELEPSIIEGEINPMVDIIDRDNIEWVQVSAASEPETPPPNLMPEPSRVFGNMNGGTRLVIYAYQTAWVHVENIERRTLITRVLEAGEAYLVPDEPGITLITDNAGGITLYLDGQPLPALGAPGEIRRNIALNPDILQ